MTLRGKLISLQLPLFLALALLSIISISALTQLGVKSQDILKDNYRSVLATQRMNEAVERIDDAAMRFFLGGKASEARSMAVAQIQVFESELAIQEGNVTEPGELELTKKLRLDWETSQNLFKQLLAYKNTNSALEFYNDKVQKSITNVRTDTYEILGLNQDAMVRKSEKAVTYSNNLKNLLLVGWACTTALALVAALYMTKMLVKPIYSLQQAVRMVGEGDLEVRAKPEGQDEVAMLARDFNSMAENLQKYRKSSLGDLIRAQQAAQASIDSLPEPIIVFDNKRDVVSINLRGEKIFGTAGNVKDFGPELGVLVNKILDHVFDGKGPFIAKGLDETIKIQGSNADHYLLPNAFPLRDEDGITIGVTLAMQDVTRFKRFDELKDDMVSTVAHEFKTPLTSIRMAIHICLDELAGPLTPKQADMLGAAREECERLQMLVDDLLDLSRLQKGITPTSPEAVNSSVLVSQAVLRHRDEAEAAHIELKQEHLGQVVQVLADQSRIVTVFDNLIANAMRYSPRGGQITIRASALAGMVRFEVIDSGPGIPAQHQERIFERMYQVPGSETGARGLGLSIVREIVLAHGGEIGVESELGKGSTFWFTLNTVRASEAPDNSG